MITNIDKKFKKEVRCGKCGSNKWEVLQGKVKCLNCGTEFHIEERLKILTEGTELPDQYAIIECLECGKDYALNKPVKPSKKIPRKSYYGVWK